MKKMIIGAALLAASVACQAQSPSPRIYLPGAFVNGNAYQRYNSLQRQVYIQGLVDGIFYSSVIAGRDLSRVMKLSDCASSHNMTDVQIVAIVDKYMADHPEHWGDPMSLTAHTALALACRKLGAPTE
ncbi:hypothetical protein WK07_20345 [Burkholderia multivorans]|uniref:hypothetical protein n=1 Tax=Burkholderia multivorans TaxID=87883 RepID=UPI0007521C0F|nr:hypothetical protein [Burkholderia multivorans]KVQ75731.1 hypothetical protein WK07_20345 [Burkholderia multivorans]